MAANTSKIQIEIRVDGKGGIKVLRQIGTESEKAGKKGSKSFRNMDRSAKATTVGLKSMHGMLLKFGIGYAAILGIRVAVREMIDMTNVASDLNETISKSRAIFGNSSAGIEAWAARSAVAIGLSTQAALENTATLGNMYQQLGAGVDVAEQSSRAMVKLSADLASFHNVSEGASGVLLSMQSAFRGEYDALQRYIPTINAAAVQEQALAMTHKATAKELTNLEKALAAQAIIVRDAGAAVGDFERTSGELANQKRILAAQIMNVKAKLGEHLVPAVTRIYQKMNDWIEANDELIAQKLPVYVDALASGLETAAIWAAKTANFMVDIKDALEMVYLLQTGRAGELFFPEKPEIPKPKFYPITRPSGIIPPTISPVKAGPDTKALKEALDLEAKLWEYEVRAAQRMDDEIVAAHEAMIEYGKALDQEAAKNKISMTEKMYADLKFTSDDYYAYQLNQLQRQSDDYETFTGNVVLAHLWLTEQIKALDQERLEAADKNNQHLIDLSQRTADAMEDNFSSFYRDFFRGELDSAEDYFRKFCYSLTDSFSDMMGQMTKEALFGGGSSGFSGLFGLLSTGVSSLFAGGAGGMGTGGAADWSSSGAWSYDVLHKGGRVGRDPAPTRNVPAFVFANAPRLHEGWPGLRKDEFPSILKYDETVLPPGVKPVNNVSNLTISVPVNIEGQGDDRLASKLSYEMEETAKRVMREEMR